MESPQEDEFGLVNLCGLSPYLGAIFARSEKVAGEKGYIKYLSFKVRRICGAVCPPVCVDCVDGVGRWGGYRPHDHQQNHRAVLASALI